MNRTRVCKALFAIAGFFIVNTASSQPIVIDFNDRPVGIFKSNFTTQGITFSPSCHYDLLPSVNGVQDSTRWIGFDMSGCSGDDDVLDTYLGAPFSGYSARLYVAPSPGSVFHLNSFKFASASADSGWFYVRSSKGGLSEQIGYGLGQYFEYKFNGPEWTNLSWIEFIGGGGAPQGFDDLALNVHPVDEPVTLALIGLGALGMMRPWRRKTRV